jgi:hypothetical protein
MPFFILCPSSLGSRTMLIADTAGFILGQNLRLHRVGLCRAVIPVTPQTRAETIACISEMRSTTTSGTAARRAPAALLMPDARPSSDVVTLDITEAVNGATSTALPQADALWDLFRTCAARIGQDQVDDAARQHGPIGSRPSTPPHRPMDAARAGTR